MKAKIRVPWFAKATSLVLCIGFVATLAGGGRWLRACRTDSTEGSAAPRPAALQVYIEALGGGGMAQATVAPGGRATLDVVLSANGTIAGTLVDTKGTPIGGMKVFVRDDNIGEVIRPPTVTAADGRFQIDHAPCACYIAVLRPPAPSFVKKGMAIESGKLTELGPILVDAPPSL